MSEQQRLHKRAFYFLDTLGVPLAMQIESAKASGWAVSMPHFYRDALAAGWKPERALTRIAEALADAGCDPVYIEKQMEWLKQTGGRELPDDGCE